MRPSLRSRLALALSLPLVLLGPATPARAQAQPAVVQAADLDGDGIPDAQDPDVDGDGLTNAEEAALRTDPRRADTDGDGYTDAQEVRDPRLTRPPADYRTRGATGADPLVRDVFIELDYLGPKTWWFVKHCGHAPAGGPIRHMVERFEEHGWHVFVCVDDEVPHVEAGRDRARLEKADVFALRDRYRDDPIYYYCFYADEAGDALGKTGKNGVSWYASNNLVVFEGVWYLIGDLVGATFMHELGHLLLDTYPANPKAGHLVSRPEVWSDGAHCPNRCVMNYASKLGTWGALAQWWRFDYCAPCWSALRGFYDRP